MLFGVFGTPSPLSYWTVAALRAAVDVVFSSHVFVETSSLAQLREALDKREGNPVVFFNDCPEAELAQAFLNADAPYLVCLEDPPEVLGFCVRARNMRPLDAMRFTVQSLSTLHDLALGPRSKAIRRSPERTVSEAVLEFCTTYSLTSDPAVAVEAVLRIAGQAELFDAPVEDLILSGVGQAWPLGASAQSLAELGVDEWMVETANQYAAPVEGRKIEAAIWPREAFLDPRGVNETVAEEQDMTGPARHLVFGPFLHLPAGQWRAVAAIQVSNVRTNALMVDVAALGAPVAVGRFDLPDKGKFEFSLDFEVKEPRAFLEVRIVMTTGAIEGAFRFGGVRLQRLPAA